MGAFEIIGGKKLKGEITPQGAKNEALQVINAVLLTPDKVTINNIPDIIDVNKLIDLLSTLGVKINKVGKGSYTFQADEIDVDFMMSDEYKVKGASLRGSIMVVGPLLARFGIDKMKEAEFGGNVIFELHEKQPGKFTVEFRYNNDPNIFGESNFYRRVD